MEAFTALSLSWQALLWCALAVALAYVARGAMGFGSGLVGMPLLALVLPLHTAVPALAVLDYLSSLVQSGVAWRSIRWRPLLILYPFSAAGIAMGLYVFDTLDPSVLERVFGTFLLVYGLVSLGRIPTVSASRLWCVPAGLAGGLAGLLFGTGSTFYVVYLRARNLPKAELRATIAMNFVIDGVMRIGAFVGAGFYTARTLSVLVLLLPVALVGLLLGARLHVSMTPEAFRRTVGVFLIAAGAGYLLR